MKSQTKKQITTLFFILTIIASIYLIPQVIAPATSSIKPTSNIPPKTYNILNQNESNETPPHLLIFLSPTYTQDKAIIQAIHFYQQAIMQSPGWTSQLIQLNKSTNKPVTIDAFIETNAHQQNLTATLLIGEDIALPVKTTYQEINKPQLSIYSTITNATDQQSICTSLLYPTPSASYQKKQTELINTLHRFTDKRKISLFKKSVTIEQSTLSVYSEKDYRKLSQTLPASYQKECNPKQFSSLFQSSHDVLCFHGHGQPHYLSLNSTMNLKLTSEIASTLPTSILSIDGCYTDSVYNDQSNNPTPFISSICRSNTMHLGFFGLLSQQTSSQSQNVINSILSNIGSNETIAEIINNAHIPFDFVFTGDPTVQLTS